jgi:hypothetical protein
MSQFFNYTAQQNHYISTKNQKLEITVLLSSQLFLQKSNGMLILSNQLNHQQFTNIRQHKAIHNTMTLIICLKQLLG